MKPKQLRSKLRALARRMEQMEKECRGLAARAQTLGANLGGLYLGNMAGNAVLARACVESSAENLI